MLLGRVLENGSTNSQSYSLWIVGLDTFKPLIIVDIGPWYRWALERLGLKYQYQTFGIRNAVERFFGYIKQRTRRFYNNINTWSIKTTQQQQL